MLSMCNECGNGIYSPQKTTVQCKVCNKDFVSWKSPAFTVCMECSEKLNLCRQCGEYQCLSDKTLPKIATYDDCELGNLVFGNSRGYYTMNSYSRKLSICPEWRRFLEILDMDAYCTPDVGDLTSNDVFELFPYYWGDQKDAASQRPNFVYKPLNIEIKWYKYSFRDAYINQPISYDQLISIIDACTKSLETSPTQKFDVNSENITTPVTSFRYMF